MKIVLRVQNLKVHYQQKGKKLPFKAVDGISFDLKQGKTIGLIGESGSGKTSTGKSITGLIEGVDGEIWLGEKDLNQLKQKDRRLYFHDIQMIFQDPYSSLNPMKRIVDIVGEPLTNQKNLSKEERMKKIIQILDELGLGEDDLWKYPHEFSGGQRQRIGIARSLIVEPKVIVADEPVSALDLSVQAQVLNFLKKIQAKYDISILFISHDLGVVKHFCDEIAIMYKGRIVEKGTVEDIFQNPQHLYTKKLLTSIPLEHPKDRQKMNLLREEVDDNYIQKIHELMDDEELPLPLIQIAKTHYAALPK